MPDFLKGNYKLNTEPNKNPKAKTKKKANGLTEQFEKEVLAKLGGSMCFVMKGKTFLWTGDESEESSS